MMIADGSIHFKSDKENYNAECIGYKKNTVRIIPEEEISKYHIEVKDRVIYSHGKRIPDICIHCGAYCIKRHLTDVCYSDERYIFSWK